MTQKHWRGMAETAVIGACIVVSAGACAGLALGLAFGRAGADYWGPRHESRSQVLSRLGFSVATAGLGFGLGKAAELGMATLSRAARYGIGAYFGAVDEIRGGCQLARYRSSRREAAC